MNLTMTNPDAFGLDPPRQYLGMSEIGMCPRKAGLRLQWARGSANFEPIPLGMLDHLRLRRGNYLEPLVCRALEACGFELDHTEDSQMECTLPNLKGHPDGMIIKSPTGEYDGWLLEVKCVQPFALDKATPAGLNEWWISQTTCYAYPLNVPGTLFALFDTSTKTRKGGAPPIKLIPAKRSRKLLDKALYRAAMICKYVDGEGALPDKDPRGSKTAPWECKTCQWRDECAKQGD